MWLQTTAGYVPQYVPKPHFNKRGSLPPPHGSGVFRDPSELLHVSRGPFPLSVCSDGCVYIPTEPGFLLRAVYHHIPLSVLSCSGV